MEGDQGRRGRRTPVQQRSRTHVGAILAATGELLRAGGVEAVTTSAVAARANISASAVYQYFANRDEVIDAYLDQAGERLDAAVMAEVGALETISLFTVLEATVLGHLHFYAANLELAYAWLTGRPSSAPRAHVLERNRALGRRLHGALLAAGLVREGVPEWLPDLSVAMITGSLEVALAEHTDPALREEIVRTAIRAVHSELQMWATPRGHEGVPREEFDL